MPSLASRKAAGGAALALAALTLSSTQIASASHTTGVSAAASPPSTVTATQVTRTNGTLKPGKVVRQRTVGHRVFANSRFGFGLAGTGGAEYPATTTNGGRTWRINGPALHLDAAQAPLAVVEVGLASRKTYFAYGGGQVVDTTNDGGKHWWRAFLGDVVLSVSAPFGPGHLTAVVQTIANSSGTTANTFVYSSTDGGRHWHLTNSIGG